MGNSPSQSKAIIWSAVERFSSQGIQFVLGIIIARLVAPSCYGLVAMLTIFISIGQSLIDSGFANALIHKKDCTEKDYSTVFYFNLVVSAVLYLLFFICSPLIADFYGQSELVVITRYSTFGFILNSLAIVQRAQFTKRMDFKRQSKATVSAVIVSGLVGVTMAYCGYGVWALVFQGLINSLVNTISLWMMSSWRPSLVFSKESFKELYAFGSRLLFTGLLSTVYINLYTLVIGKFFSSTQLGFFNKMQNIAVFPSRNITSIMSRAVYPKQCKLQNDNIALHDNYMQLLSLSSFFIFPLMGGLAALAQPLVSCLLGEAWVSAWPYLSILSIAYMFDHLQYFNWQMLAVKGRSDLSLKSEIIKKVASVIILVSTIPFGVKVMAMGLVLYAIIDLLIIIPFVHKVIPSITYGAELKVLVRPFVLTAIMCVAILMFISLFSNHFVQLFGGFIIGGICYLLIAYMMKMPEFIYYIDKIKKK